MTDDKSTPSDETTEEWRDVPGYEGLYQVSNTGMVRRVETGRLLKLRRHRDGYRSVVLYGGPTSRHLFTHVLVASAFIGPCPDGHEANHKNGERSDNRPENLEWVTRGQNVLHSYRQLGATRKAGEVNGMAKLTDDNVRDIRQRSLEGMTQTAIARMYGVSQSTVSLILLGKTWKHV